ncbi:hypothetical protein EUX98_g3071 [Antrodiella citrinella]|uniref:Uncharacterized protein n=1 Tax=Antrodiella citrinella TaxID=2447956 RepID=A0A4S4MZM8_9APHY|nr:hypothetical protein EUX98_g3071 [Antrodiella citrinella]
MTLYMSLTIKEATGKPVEAERRPQLQVSRSPECALSAIVSDRDLAASKFEHKTSSPCRLA